MFAYESIEGFPERTDAERRGLVVVEDTVIADNEVAGILMTGTAAPELRRVTVSGNGGCGLCYSGASGGAVSDAMIEGNQVGIQIDDDASPEIVDTDIVDNAAIGVSISGGSAARLETSKTERNGNIGVQVVGSASPIVDRNTIRNHGVGVLVGETATPHVVGNVIANHEIGIQIGGEADVEIEENLVWVSSVAAISIGGSSTSIARSNSIDEAPEAGIQASGEAVVDLRENIIESPGVVGLIYVDNASGSAVGNEVRDRDIGVQVGDTAHPELIDNTIVDSIDVGILYDDEASGRVAENLIDGPESVGDSDRRNVGSVDRGQHDPGQWRWLDLPRTGGRERQCQHDRSECDRHPGDRRSGPGDRFQLDHREQRGSGCVRWHVAG